MKNEMPIRAQSYRHQQEAFRFSCDLLGLPEGGDAKHSMGSRGAALLMEM